MMSFTPCPRSRQIDIAPRYIQAPTRQLLFCTGYLSEHGSFLDSVRDSSLSNRSIARTRQYRPPLFFQLHPWLYLLLIPVLCTHLWSDVHKEGAIDFLYSLPISYFELVIGKFLAAWVISALALLLTFPIIVTINYFGSPDNGVIASQFLGSWLLAGAYLSIGCLICVLTCHRLIIFMLTLALLLAVGGLSSVLDALDHQAPVWIVDTLLSLSPFARFSAIDNGTLVLQDYLFFISMTLAFLASTIVALKLKKAE